LQWIAVLLRSAIFLVRSKVTLEEVLQSSELEQNYGARLCPGWVRIGVRNVQEAKQWYHKYVGMSVLEEHKEQGDSYGAWSRASSRYIVMVVRNAALECVYGPN
jgi:catechol-2,3-dioxygenase